MVKICSSDHERLGSDLFCPECLNEIAWQCPNGHVVELKVNVCKKCDSKRTFTFSDENPTEVSTIEVESSHQGKRELIPDVIRLKKFRKRRKIFLAIFFLLIILVTTASGFGVFKAANVKIISSVDSLSISQPNSRLYANVSVKVHEWSTSSRLICDLFIPSKHISNYMKREWGLRGNEKYDMGTFEVPNVPTNTPI